jgi:Mg2+ and Co2+ transporter CorA
MSDINESYAKLDKRLSLLEQRLDIIQNNHLAHIQADINNIKRYFLWGVGVVFVQLIAVIAVLATN